MKYKLYTSKSEYTKRLEIINKEMGFPSKKYQKYVLGRLRNFTSKKIMTRTWANENPRKTLSGEYPLPIEGKSLTGLVNYDKNWYDDKIALNK